MMLICITAAVFIILARQHLYYITHVAMSVPKLFLRLLTYGSLNCLGVTVDHLAFYRFASILYANRMWPI